VPGKSTTLRTGTMTIASSGKGRDPASRRRTSPVAGESTRVPASAVTGSELRIVCSFMSVSGDLAQSEDQASVGELACTAVELDARQRNAPLEVAVRDLELAYGAARTRKRQRFFGTNNKHAPLVAHVDAIGRNAGKGDDDHDSILVLEHIDRRLPGRTR